MSQESNATLCLACSSSLPPRLLKQAQQARDSSLQGQVEGPSSDLFLTRCCARPICPPCLASNPPCLGGTDALGMAKAGKESSAYAQRAASNVDGAVRDEDVFVVGDEDDDERQVQSDGTITTTHSPVGSGPLEHDLTNSPSMDTQYSPILDKLDEPSGNGRAGSGRYYIQPDDTLLGISLRFGIDGRTLCRLNSLPPSTLRTTPHFLHTRTYLILPPSHSQHATSKPTLEEEMQHASARAQAVFRQVTKEADWGIAQAYVALAEDSDSEPDALSPKPEGEKKSQDTVRAGRTGAALEERAVDRYLDDDEWERRERAEGRGVHIPSFPLGGPSRTAVSKGGEGSGHWWQRWGG
ncbi:hypothetical protein BC834DRAFT_882856 [Gloeopeniophorella convolvens]|nr:hypothetical protein BC834DRAFT_882856 [Gloeopeniophorella convolvens]